MKNNAGLRLEAAYAQGEICLCHSWGSLLVPIQTPQLTDPEKTDTSTKRQSTNCTLSFAIIEMTACMKG